MLFQQKDVKELEEGRWRDLARQRVGGLISLEAAGSRCPFSLEDLLRPLPPAAKVLDLGCGGGSFRYSDFRGVQVTAIDETVHPNVKNFPANAKFLLAVASAIPCAAAAFDLVVVNFAFEHFPEPNDALPEIDRVARDGAYVWISVPNASSFEDQLYRNLFAGGGHLQTPTLDRFLRLTYRTTSLKLVSFVEIPAGFTFLGESEELRHLTWAFVDALRKSVGIDASSKSGYIFVLKKSASLGQGYREYTWTCYACGAPQDDALEPVLDATRASNVGWRCSRCDVVNSRPSNLQEIQLDRIERAQRVHWKRYPETHPAELRRMYDARGQWGQELERDLERSRQRNGELEQAGMRRLEELDREWKTRYGSLQQEFDDRGKWALELDRERLELRAEVENLRRLVSELGKPIGWLKHVWRRFRRALVLGLPNS